MSPTGPHPPGSIESVSSSDPDEPYVAFNVWSYEDGELKLSSVKKIPVKQVLGAEFYSDVTKNNTDSVLVVADSFLISRNNSAVPASSTVSEVDKKENNELPSKVVTDSSNNLFITPKPLSSPITASLDLVSYIENDATQGLKPVNAPSFPNAYEKTKNAEGSVHKPTVIPIKVQPISNIFKNTHSNKISIDKPNQLSTVFITPQGVKLSQNAGNDIGPAAIQQLIANIQGHKLFEINETSAKPHRIRVSLINDQGVPTDPYSLPNANLISIISNKPTIINHNVYHIKPEDISHVDSQNLVVSKTQAGSLQHPVPSEFKPQSNNPVTEQNAASQSTTSPHLPSTVIPTPEEILLNELESIDSFNNIINGLSLDHFTNPVNIETMALEGILDTKPELFNTVREPEVPINAHNPETIQPPEALIESILPVTEKSQTSINISDKSDLNILEHLLRRKELPKQVEIAILTDVLSGSTVSEAIISNIDKHKDLIDKHIKKNGSIDMNSSVPSPLSVIDAFDSSQSIKSDQTFITRVNVESVPLRQSSNIPVRSASELQNCFKDTACTFALSLAIAAFTTGSLSVPFITPILGRSLGSTIQVVDRREPNELMSTEDAGRIMKAITKYANRNGRSARNSQNNIREYMGPYVSYLSHKLFPRIFSSPK